MAKNTSHHSNMFKVDNNKFIFVLVYGLKEVNLERKVKRIK